VKDRAALASYIAIEGPEPELTLLPPSLNLENTGDHRMNLFRRTFVPLLICLVLSACGGGGDDSTGETRVRVATFLAPQNDMLEAAPFPGQGPAFPEFREETLRQIAHISVGGEAIKIKFSNLFGVTPLTLDKVRVAKSLGSGSIDQSTDKPVTFSGYESVTISPGAELFSDEVAFGPSSLSDVAVSIYMKQATVRTAHRASTTTSYVGAGDAASSPAMPGARTSTSTYYMPAIDVIRRAKVNVVVAFGDSITDGVASTRDAYNSWPDQLSAITNAKFDVSVVNAGLGGNRWVKDSFGPCGLCRFERDVVNVSGATHVILMLGINDIGLGYTYANIYQDPSWVVTAKQITDNMQAAIDLAKAKGLKVYAGTIVPFKNSFYYTTGQPDQVPFGMTVPYDGEAVRQAVNAFVRTNTTVDGVIDFDLAMQNPADPLQQRPGWNSGDNLHPNDAGYANIAKAVDIDLLR
jgi:lysophospholipase L1-like esterase